MAALTKTMRHTAQQVETKRAARAAVVMLATLALLLTPVAEAARTQLKPGWNVFSPAQDVELGQRLSADAARQFPILRDAKVETYINNLGKRLARYAPFEKYPYTFRVINDKTINAFALPGGPVFINRGVIEAADTEAQLAGVMAHEIGHVALRHGTNQASKQQFASLPLAILGGVLGSNSIGASLAQLGAGIATSGVLLKYSRDAERQADLLGTQILYDANYDPRAMAQFFEKLQAENKGRGGIEFFQSHPNPENRLDLTLQEVQKLGGPPRNYKSDSAEFREIHSYILSLPAPTKGGSAGTGASRPPSGTRPQLPSTRMRTFQNEDLSISYPDNWRPYGQGSAVTFAPEGGTWDDGQGNSPLAYGLIANVYEGDGRGWRNIEEATNDLIRSLQESNPRMRASGGSQRIRIDGRDGLSLYLTNDSPAEGRERLWLVTALHSDGLHFFVGVAPENEFSEYERTFRSMFNSVRFSRN